MDVSPDILARGKAKVVAVIGAGKIGEAIATKMSKSGIVKKVIVTKRNVDTLNISSKKIQITSNNSLAAKGADVIFLSVKAADAKEVLGEISGHAKGKLVISVMAAVSIKKLERALPGSFIIRAMPNISAMIGEAVTAYSLGTGVKEEHSSTARVLFGSFGTHVEVPESAMDAVTAISGSGPAYIAVLIDAMISGALKVGLSRDVAFKLVTKTLTGTADLLEQHKMHPAELRDIVTTPAGTTIAGIYELEKGSFRTSIMNAIEAATQASSKVGAKFESE
ncbi:MAG: pyrroline-5-carboxylate reductase [Candidatus Thermoplasmatota archaeon]|jgi:pyrroline-5-carboxylate reductase|nr:pyrroline-5-carboxylate reductase [Candidatus Thermoplasmatota archaeon]